MILATVYALMALFGGDGMEIFSVEQLKPLIEKHVVSEDRQDQLVEMVKAEQKKADEFNKQATKASKKLLKINKDPSSSEADFHVIIDATEKSLLQIQDGYIDLRFDLKEKMTQEEWAAVFSQK